MTYRDERDAKIAQLEAENLALRTQNEVQAREISDLIEKLKAAKEPPEPEAQIAYLAHALQEGQRVNFEKTIALHRAQLRAVSIGLIAVLTLISGMALVHSMVSP